jgi:hypothetical protein
VTRVEVPKFVAGTELVWRLSRGNFRSGYHYALEDTAGHESADAEYSHLGYLKRIYVPTAEYRCRRGIGVKRGRIDVLDVTTGEFVAAINLGRHGTITAGSHPTLRVTIKGRRAATATMKVVDAAGAAIMTLRWTEAATSAKRLFPQGRATLADTDLGDDVIVVVACLAFHGFAAEFS